MHSDCEELRDIFCPLYVPSGHDPYVCFEDPPEPLARLLCFIDPRTASTPNSTRVGSLPWSLQWFAKCDAQQHSYTIKLCLDQHSVYMRCTQCSRCNRCNRCNRCIAGVLGGEKDAAQFFFSRSRCRRFERGVLLVVRERTETKSGETESNSVY